MAFASGRVDDEIGASLNHQWEGPSIGARRVSHFIVKTLRYCHDCKTDIGQQNFETTFIVNMTFIAHGWRWKLLSASPDAGGKPNFGCRQLKLSDNEIAKPFEESSIFF